MPQAIISQAATSTSMPKMVSSSPLLEKIAISVPILLIFAAGNVTINATGIFGTQFRNAPTQESEITATGANPSLSGNVQINTPNLDPSRGLLELYSNLVDQSHLIAQGCPANRGDVFTITGRGGLPPLPNEVLRSNQTATVNWVTLGERGRGGEGERGGITKVSGSKLPNQIVPATGWVINDNGDVTLIASANTTFQSLTPTTCPGLLVALRIAIDA